MERIATQHIPRGKKPKAEIAQPPSDHLWSPEEVSDFLRIPIGTVNSWRSRHKGPRFHKVGKHVRYFPEDVIDYVKGRSA